MRNPFKAQAQSMLGIDISSTSVKAIEILNQGDQPIIQGYGSVRLPESSVESGLIKEMDYVANSIRQLVTNCRLKSKKVAIAVPDSTAISKIIQVNEELSDQEIEELVIMEADKYIPYPIDEINIDFSVVGPSAKSTSMLDVLIVASKAENVTNRIDVMNRAGLDVVVVDVESFAVERAAQLVKGDLPAGGENKNIAIIDIGSMYTRLFILNNMKIIYSREEEFGGKQLIDLLVQQYGIKEEEALDKIDNNQLPDDFKDRVQQPFEEMLLMQVKRTLQFFFSTTQYTFVDHVVLAGGVSKQSGIAELIQEGINVPTTVVNLFDQMIVAKSVDESQIRREAPTLMVSCGLALRRVDE